MYDWIENVVELESNIGSYPNPGTKVFQYGTSGIRYNSEHLDHVQHRMGLLVALRSIHLKSAAVGLMITASHNPQDDNGIKLIDPQGEMLDSSWEVYATELANAPNNQDVCATLINIAKKYNIDKSYIPRVYIGRDTRNSGKRLLDAVLCGVKAFKSNVEDFGIITTPMLHFFVRCYNTNCLYGQPNEHSYYSKLTNSFKTLRKMCLDLKNYSPVIEFDGANGVGALKMKDAIIYLEETLVINMHNDDILNTEKLNHKCGADFVKSNQCPPTGMTIKPYSKYVSVDGDADRIVYSFIDENNKFYLLDGDRIATLVAGYIKELFDASGLDVNVGLVQTAYSNGNSTKYVTDKLKVPVACVPTGVKYLHHKANDYDVGIYFEANGHGTILFQDAIRELIRNQSAIEKDEAMSLALKKLICIMDMTNETVGDAYSDMLLVESVLCERGWSISDWYKTYSDLPNRLTKVTVKDRNTFETGDAERICIKPPGLQGVIDSIVSKYSMGRSFVRPSGTEDLVRIYAEADTQTNADKLAVEVATAVYDIADGVGKKPE
ncbi:phosphoacetylglucosamine mutase [Myzus persicae]|uniref:phosphoacetylglucosamine mutase n=1 Tax=Myzus persicae TaxID=13164 RepID=UPI000B939AE0|nr:phosphoacetylglucosamine mutase [Myzus persicae]XP_022182535.1 phosphoacetylglucosamine mutase [Myzus persicae]